MSVIGRLERDWADRTFSTKTWGLGFKIPRNSKTGRWRQADLWNSQAKRWSKNNVSSSVTDSFSNQQERPIKKNTAHVFTYSWDLISTYICTTTAHLHAPTQKEQLFSLVFPLYPMRYESQLILSLHGKLRIVFLSLNTFFFFYVERNCVNHHF